MEKKEQSDDITLKSDRIANNQEINRMKNQSKKKWQLYFVMSMNVRTPWVSSSQSMFYPSFLHVFPILPKLPPEHGENDGRQQDEAAGCEVSNGQEMVLTSKPGQCGQHHFLLALEVLHRKV